MKFRNCKRSFLICGMFLSCHTLTAQSVADSTISALSYRERVMNYSLELKQAKEGVSQAESGIRTVRSGMLPQLSGALDFNYMMKTIAFDLGQTSLKLKPYNYGASVTAAQNIYSGGVVRKQERVAEFSADMALSNEKLTIDNIIFNADYAYWSMAAITAYVNIAEEYLTVVKGTHSLVQERFQNGLISKNDLLLIQTRLSEAELNYSIAEGQYKNAAIGVNMLMGQSPSSIFSLSEGIFVKNTTLPEEANMEEVLRVRPEYLIASSQVDQNKEFLRVTKSDYLPQVAVGVTGQYQTQSINFDGKALFNGIAFAQVKVPIFSGNSRKHRVAIDNSKVRASEYAMKGVEDKIVQDVASSWSNLTESSKQLTIAKQNLETATQSLNLSSFSFNQGLLSILDLMQAQLSWFGAYNNSVKANYNYRIAMSQYFKAIGAYDRYL